MPSIEQPDDGVVPGSEGSMNGKTFPHKELLQDEDLRLLRVGLHFKRLFTLINRYRYSRHYQSLTFNIMHLTNCVIVAVNKALSLNISCSFRLDRPNSPYGPHITNNGQQNVVKIKNCTT